MDPLRKVGAEMDEKLMGAISEFITRRMDDLSTDASEAVTDAVTAAGEQMDRLAATLTPEQVSPFHELENALSLQTGEETRYYYRAGFCDAVKFLLEWSCAD